MEIICAASLDSNSQKEKLCRQIRELGVVPCVSGMTVCAEYIGDRATAEKFIELFEQYARHGISTIEDLKGGDPV